MNYEFIHISGSVLGKTLKAKSLAHSYLVSKQFKNSNFVNGMSFFHEFCLYFCLLTYDSGKIFERTWKLLKKSYD